MNYENLRYFADTWGLVVLAGIFVLMLIFIFRRGTTKKYEAAARIATDAPEHLESDTSKDADRTGSGADAERKD